MSDRRAGGRIFVHLRRKNYSLVERGALRNKEEATMKSLGHKQIWAQLCSREKPRLQTLYFPSRVPNIHACLHAHTSLYWGHTQTPFCSAEVIPMLIQQTFMVHGVGESSSLLGTMGHITNCRTKVQTRMFLWVRFSVLSPQPSSSWHPSPNVLCHPPYQFLSSSKPCYRSVSSVWDTFLPLPVYPDHPAHVTPFPVSSSVTRA